MEIKTRNNNRKKNPKPKKTQPNKNTTRKLKGKPEYSYRKW